MRRTKGRCCAEQPDQPPPHPNRRAGNPARNPTAAEVRAARKATERREIMARIIIKTTAEQVVVFAYSLSEDGTYRRPRDSELRDEFGGRMVSSSNDGESIISFN